MDDVAALSRAIASDLENVYGDGLVEHVDAALSGGVRSGQSRHMVDWASIGSLTDVSALLVSIVSTTISYVSLQRAGPGNPNLTVSDANTAAINQALGEVIGDLGVAQQPVARKLQGEVLQWLEARRQA